MIKTYALVLSVFVTTLAFAQATYNGPESVEYDYTNNRWLIANTDNGNILARSNTGVLSVFTAGPLAPYGIEIVGTTLYVCDGSRIKGYNLTSAAEVFNVNTGATFLNGITHDNSGNLYATDFSAKKIYKIKIATQQVTTFVTGLAKSPNGIIYDQPNNRCVFVNWGTNAPIMAVSLADSTTSTITTTTLSNCDGIAKDGAGNYYVSSWGLNGISKFNNTFMGGPTTVVTSLSSPADIFYNTVNDTLAVPNSGNSNNVGFYYLGPPPPCATPTIFPNNLILCPNTSDTLFTEEWDSYQWFKDGNLIQNATGQYYVVDAFTDGGSNFSVEATLNNCTQMSAEVLVDGWVFLPPYVITEGLSDTLCIGDTLLLIMGLPYDTLIQWTRNNQPIPNGTNDTLVVTIGGSYSVSGAPSICPGFVQNLGLQLVYTFTNCETSIDDEKQAKITLYPNPATDIIAITGNLPNIIPYTITDMFGRLVLSGQLKGENAIIAISALPIGMYVLTLNTSTQKSFKIIKQ